MDIEDCRVIYREPGGSGLTVAEGDGRRNIYLDGGILQSSMLLADPSGLCLDYSLAMMSCLLFTPAPGRVLLVGLGGGSIVKFLLRACPEARIDAAEISWQVIRAAREYFLLPANERLEVINAPGEEVVAAQLAAGGNYDLILIDAFDDSGPARGLLEEQFVNNCRALLAGGGVFAMNLWNRPEDNFPANFARLSSLFEGRTYKILLDGAHRNSIVFGFNHALPAGNLMELKQAALELSRRTGVNFIRWLRQLYWQNISQAG